MYPFSFVDSASADQALAAVGANSGAVFLAGGTTLIDLMKLDVMTPTELVSVNDLPFSEIQLQESTVIIGANVRNSTLAHNRDVRANFPALSEALLAGASAQLRNMASTAGNIMQRTRCEYFRDIRSRCNKRTPGSGCDAFQGLNRHHALLGTSEHCAATNPSDMCVALAMLDTTLHTRKADGTQRALPFGTFHREPGTTPHLETILEHAELITHIEIKKAGAAANSHYLKVRDRASYEFALCSAAVGLEFQGGTIKSARVALGGIATRPWRSGEAERALEGQPATVEAFTEAAKIALAGAKPLKDNGFKVDLAMRTIVYALEELSGRVA
jgi:xanthine dehydrogenase YagS FAD-binding subunit